jgi:molecular chaperone DnaK
MILTRPIGIDLGTTNSAVALLDPNERDLFLWRDTQGRAIVPSCVWRDPKTREIVVGFPAYARRGTRPEPIVSIKRAMGTQMTVTLGDERRSAAEISSYILKALKQRMEADLQRRAPAGVCYDVGPAIITVPAYFDLPAIESTRVAGEMAGLQVTELLHEPTAAAIYYCWKKNLGDGIYMVYDLGGGTFDISILRRVSGEFMVLGIAGDNFLGGDDFDRRLAEHIRQLLVADQYDMELDVAGDAEDQLRLQKLTVIAEEVKKGLSTAPEYLLRNQGSLIDKAGVPVVIETTITRDVFESLIGDLLDRTIDACHVALERARQSSGVTIADVEHVVLVGGSTYVPAVVERITSALCGPGGDAANRTRCAAPIREDPDTAVALGAALRAGANGLGVGDDDRRVRLWFRSAGATRSDRATISGHVECLAPGLSLEQGSIRLSGAAGEDVSEVSLASGLRFSFPQVALEPDSLNRFGFAISDAAGQVIATVERSILRGEDQREPVGRALSTAVLSKPILLEGADGDRLVRTVLLPEGTSLPAKAKFTFSLGDPTGRIRLPIYQASRIIKELSADVGDVRVGTPVEIEIDCDAQVRIEVRFSLNDRVFGGKIQPPPPDAVPTEFDIERVHAKFGSIVRTLDTSDAELLAERYDNARRDAVEALRTADYPKLIQRVSDLEALTREARLAEPLDPPIDVVERNYQACQELLPQAIRTKPDLAQSQLAVQIDKALTRAREAYQARQGQDYEDAAQAISASRQYLTAVTHAVVSTDDPRADVSVHAALAFQQTQGITHAVLMHCLFTRQTPYVGALTQQLAELQQLEPMLRTNPVDVLHRCQVLDTEARRIYQQISGDEKRASDLQGLLRIEGRSYTTATTSADMIGER